MSCTHIGFSAALFLASVTTVFAQTTPAPVFTAPISPGDRLDILVSGTGEVLHGRLVDVRGDRVTLKVPNATERGPAQLSIDVPMTQILQIDIERRDSVLNGAFVGALYLAACFKWWCGQGTSGPMPSPWVGAGIGALVGGAIDAGIYKRETVFRAPARGTPLRLTVSHAFRF